MGTADPKGPTPDLCDNVEWIIGPDDVTPEVTAQFKADQAKQLREGRKLLLEEKVEAARAKRRKAVPKG
jgi:hypothetical protein